MSALPRCWNPRLSLIQKSALLGRSQPAQWLRQSADKGGSLAREQTLRVFFPPVSRRFSAFNPRAANKRQEDSSSQRQGGEEQGRRNRSLPRSWTTSKLVLQLVIITASFQALLIVADHTPLSQRILEWRTGRSLNETTFVPFTIAAREDISPTAFVLTLRPAGLRSPEAVAFARRAHVGSWEDLWQRWVSLDLFPAVLFAPGFARERHASRTVIEDAWRHGLWSVEIKQPQLQVARDYTPLPPAYGREEAALDAGEIRLLIRRMEGGEVSSYISSLRPGDKLELRGPHLGFDARARLGSAKRVVFLAGGTGIAPALQVATAVLDGIGSGHGSGPRSPAGKPSDEPSVTILWANRKRSDCVGCPDMPIPLGPRQTARRWDQTSDSVLHLLQEMQQRHQGRFQFSCVVDEERSFISVQRIEDAVRGDGGGDNSLHSVSRNLLDGAEHCHYHSETVLAVSPEKDPVGTKCDCGRGGEGSGIQGGRNLLFVSGPEGFVKVFAGPKHWATGLELQGPVRGILGKMQARSGSLLEDWLVLKL